MRDASSSAAPIVSVVIPTFEREVLVQDAIDSVLGQGETTIEILVGHCGLRRMQGRWDDVWSRSARDGLIVADDQPPVLPGPRVAKVYCRVSAHGARDPAIAHD